MALIRGHTRDRIGSCADADLACIGLCTRIAVVTGRAIGLVRIRTRAGHCIARSCVMALIRGRTHDRIGSRTHPRLARIGLRTSIPVIAHRAIGFVRIRANARHRIAYARIVALIGSRTCDGISSDTRAGCTYIGLRAAIAIVAGSAIHFVWIRANTRHGIACSRIMALIGRRTHDRVCPSTDAHLARVRLRTCIAVITHRTIGCIRMHGHTGGTSLQRADIAIVQRFVVIVWDVDEFAIAIAHVHEAIICRLARDGRIFCREGLATRARRAGTLHAFVIRTWTICGRITPDALAHVVAYERTCASLRRAIRALGQIRIHRRAHRACIARARIAVVGQICIVVAVDDCPIAITNPDLAITRCLIRQWRSHSGKINSTNAQDACSSLAGIIGSRTIRWCKTFNALPFVIALAL